MLYINVAVSIIKTNYIKIYLDFLKITYFLLFRLFNYSCLKIKFTEHQLKTKVIFESYSFIQYLSNMNLYNKLNKSRISASKQYGTDASCIHTMK